MSTMSTITQKTVRKELDAETGEYVVRFSKLEQELSNGGKRYTLVVEKDVKESRPERVTLWLNDGEKVPDRNTAIVALIERSQVTNLQNGRDYFNADVRIWDFA